MSDIGLRIAPKDVSTTISHDKAFTDYVLPSNLGILKRQLIVDEKSDGVKDFSFSVSDKALLAEFDPTSEASVLITINRGGVSGVKFTKKDARGELSDMEIKVIQSIHKFSKIDWGDLRIYHGPGGKEGHTFVNFLSQLRDTQDATRIIGMETWGAFSDVGIIDAKKMKAIRDFAAGNAGIAFITSTGDLRNSAIRDCTNSELKKEDETVLSEVKERAFKSDHKSAVVYYNRKKGTFRSFVKEDPMGEYQPIQLTFYDEGHLKELSFHNSIQSDAEFELKTGEHAMGFTKHELKALSLVSLFNAKVNTANHEFTVAYSKSNQTEDAPMVSELELAVPNYFERKSKRTI